MIWTCLDQSTARFGSGFGSRALVFFGCKVWAGSGSGFLFSFEIQPCLQAVEAGARFGFGSRPLASKALKGQGLGGPSGLERVQGSDFIQNA